MKLTNKFKKNIGDTEEIYSTQEDNEPKMKVFIFDLDSDLKFLDNVKVIRIKSKDYNVMIMSDHTPFIGELDGSITILTNEEEIRLDNISGFYSHLNNEFRFITKNCSDIEKNDEENKDINDEENKDINKAEEVEEIEKEEGE